MYKKASQGDESWLNMRRGNLSVLESCKVLKNRNLRDFSEEFTMNLMSASEQKNDSTFQRLYDKSL